LIYLNSDFWNFKFRLRPVLNYFVILKECPVMIQPSVFLNENIFTVNYLVDTFFENVDVPNLKFKYEVS